MGFSPELQQARLLEFHFGCQTMRHIAHIHDASVVYAQLAYDDVVDGCRHLQIETL